MHNNNKFTPISEIGENKLIERISKKFINKQDSTILGVGDDSAIFKHSAANQTVISTDMLVEGVHFDLMYTPLKHLGYKAIIVNVSDVCAMNSSPKQVLVSLAIPNKYSVEMIEEIYEGVFSACVNYNIDLIGGDTTANAGGLVISVTILGDSPKKRLVKRSGANANDLIVVTGNLGGAYLGLQILEREKMIFTDNTNIQPELGVHSYVLQRQLKPEARIDIINQLSGLNIVPSSMIDISDGLSIDLQHVCKKSNLGFKIFEDKIPIAPESKKTAQELSLDPTICALHGGEDYELLFTVPTETHSKIESIKECSIIGHMASNIKTKELITVSGSSVNLEKEGWDSFVKSNI